MEPHASRTGTHRPARSGRGSGNRQLAPPLIELLAFSVKVAIIRDAPSMKPRLKDQRGGGGGGGEGGGRRGLEVHVATGMVAAPIENLESRV